MKDYKGRKCKGQYGGLSCFLSFASLLLAQHCLSQIPVAVEALQSSPISLSTKTFIPNKSPVEVQNFLATPENWPKIVLSSFAVQVPPSSTRKTKSVSNTFRVGDEVDEIFGLPPIIPLSVQWTCTKSTLPRGNQPGRLEFDSINGLDGVASNCKMIFDVSSVYDNNIKQSSSQSATAVELTMQYKPVSPLATLAIPILTIDNALALKVLLPLAINANSNEAMSDLDKFRRLMGTLYGVAGLAHLADCTMGQSQLLTMAGAPGFASLSFEGQAYALLWCFVGPISFVLSRLGSRLADAGLVLYGMVEVIGAGLISLTYNPSSNDMLVDPFSNAVLVQVVVAMAWIYSSQEKAAKNSF